MKATIRSWQVEDRGPALQTRQQHADGSVTYEGVFDVTLHIKVIGNDTNEFLEHIRSARPGTALQAIQIAMPTSKLRGKLTGIANGRKYVFE